MDVHKDLPLMAPDTSRFSRLELTQINHVYPQSFTLNFGPASRMGGFVFNKIPGFLEDLTFSGKSRFARAVPRNRAASD
ncbi:hypothetical protein PWP93_35890 [Paraburkholderia sp. A1RI-2L]|uniref:hypothetical protein n=1 Tax=Paraburkholderia sp. A1RI-2L TaxID=3028367 RepID=UPI003B81CEAE